jgi:predicted nucleic acid-binding protein
MSAILIDTNVLVYSIDRGEFEKQARAIDLLNRLQPSGAGCIPVQCLSEFFVVSTRSIRGRSPLLTPIQAANQAVQLSRAFRTLDLTIPVVQEAMRGVIEHQLSFYDAQIWAAARLNQIPFLFSEDFQDGQVLESVQFTNPFAASFDLAAWL